MSQVSWTNMLSAIKKAACVVNKDGSLIESNANYKKSIDHSLLAPLLRAYDKQTDKIGFIQYQVEEDYAVTASITEIENGYLIVIDELNDQTQDLITKQYHKLFIESFPGGSITLIDLNYNILYTAGQGYAKYNIDPTVYYNKAFSTLVDTDVYEFMIDHLPEISSGKTTYYESTFKDTAYSTTFRPILNEDNELDKILIVVNDISELHKYQLKLFAAKENLQHYRQILEQSINEIYLFDATTLKFTFLNNSAEQNLGYNFEEWSDLTPVDIKPLFDESVFKKLIEPLLNGEVSQLVFETIHKRKNGSTYDVEVRLQLIDNENSSYFYAIILDISERNQYTKELREAKLLAEQASHAKSEFLATMSHEIRTPLNAIVGYTDLLSDLDLSSDASNYVQTIHNSSRSLMSIINDILDYAKIEAGKLTLLPETVSLTKIMEESMSQVTIIAEKKGLSHHIVIDESIPNYIEIDPVRLRQILVNLLSNAVKFTQQGSVTLGVYLVKKGSDPASKELQFYVQDTGVGIKKENQQRIFEAFTQEYNFVQKQYGGTGLGLNICNHLLALMNTKLEIQSEVGKGTKFHFNLIVETKEYQEEEDLALTWKTALIIDDDKDSQQLLKNHLAQLGITADTSESALDAISTVKNQHYDLIFVDHNMPYMSGIEFVKFLKDSIAEALGHQHLILLNSSLTEDELNTIIKSLPVDGLIHKPLTKWRLQQLLKSLSLNAKNAVAKVEAEPAKSPYKRILIVEDQQVNTILLQTMLHKFEPSLEIDCAENGQEAVNLVDASSYDLILMDIQMPVMNGYEATSIIRKELQFENPIVALTANVVKGEFERCIEAGMDDYLFKPLTKDKLHMMLRKWQNSINESKPVQNSNETKRDKPEEHLAHFNKNALLEKVGGDFKAVEQMMEIAWNYFKEVPELLETTKTQPEELHNHAHKLKGTALNMEFSILARLARNLMHEIDQKAPYYNLIKDIHDEITLIKQILDQ